MRCQLWAARLIMRGAANWGAYLATSQTAPVPTAVMAADIASAIAMSLTHSQIDTVRSQLARLLHLHC